MLLKSLAVAVTAAALGPALGIATFFLANGLGQQSLLVTHPLESHLVATAAADPAAAPDGWQTTVRCPDGQALSGDRCAQNPASPPSG